MLVCVSKQASKQASTHGWHSLCVSKFSSKLCLQLEIRKEAAKLKHYVPQEGKERKYAKQNVSHLTDILITLPSGLPF